MASSFFILRCIRHGQSMTEDTPRADPWSATVAQMQQELLQRWLKLDVYKRQEHGL